MIEYDLALVYLQRETVFGEDRVQLDNLIKEIESKLTGEQINYARSLREELERESD